MTLTQSLETLQLKNTLPFITAIPFLQTPTLSHKSTNGQPSTTPPSLLFGALDILCQDSHTHSHRLLVQQILPTQPPESTTTICTHPLLEPHNPLTLCHS